MHDMTATADWDVAGQFRVLLRRWKAVAVVFVLVVGAAMAISLTQEPLYQASVDVLLQRPESEVIFELNQTQSGDQARRVETEMAVIKSEPVHAAVRQRLGAVSKATVAQVGSSDIVRVRATAATRRRAAQVATAYANSYIEYRRAGAVADLDRAARKIQAKIDDLQRQLGTLIGSDPATTAGREQLTTQVALYRQRLGDLRVDADLRSGGAQLVTRGAAPTVQVQPAPLRTGVVAGMVGLLLGVGMAWLRERLDESVKGKEDVERLLGGAPTLALIPAVEGWRDREASVLVSVEDPSGPAAEAYRSLRTSLQFIGSERAPRVVQVTSANPGEGKTTTLCNLAVAMVRAGRRVVVVDADLRRARVHEFFGVSNEVGFSSVAAGMARVEEAVTDAAIVPGLVVLPSGPLPPNPSELLASQRTAELLLSLQNSYDVVLIDTPPMLPVTDATVMSSWVEAVVMVVVPGQTKRRELHRAGEMLRQADAPLVGAVVNQTSRGSGYPSTYYAYGYRSAAGTPASDSGNDDTGVRPTRGGVDGLPTGVTNEGERARISDS